MWRLYVADVTSKCGDWLAFIAITSVILDRGGSLAMSLYGLLRVAGPALCGPIAGAWGMRFRPAAVMVTSSLVRATLFTVAMVSVVLSWHWGWLVACSTLAGFASSFFSPAERRLHKTVVPADALQEFNGKLMAYGLLAIIVAPTAGTAISGWVGMAGLLAIDVATMVCAAVLIAGFWSVADQPADAAGQPAAKASWLSTAAMVWRDTPTVCLVLLQWAGTFMAASSLLVLVPVAQWTFGSSSDSGLLISIVGVGSILGARLGGRRGVMTSWRGASCSLVAALLMYLLIGVTNTMWLLAVACFLIGLFANIPDPLYWTTYQQRTPPDQAGHVFGAIDSTIVIVMAAGSALVGVLLKAGGIAWACWGCAGISALAVLAAVAVGLFRRGEAADLVEAQATP